MVKVEILLLIHSIKCILMRINIKLDFLKIENKAFSTLTTLTTLTRCKVNNKKAASVITTVAALTLRGEVFMGRRRLIMHDPPSFG